MSTVNQSETIRDLLERGQPAKVALVVAGAGVSITYDQLRRQVDELSAMFNRLGLGRDDRIAMALPNGLEALIAFLAAAHAATAAPLNPAYKRDEFAFYLQDTRAKALIVQPQGADEALAAADEGIIILRAQVGTEGRLQVVSSGRIGVEREPAQPHPEETALVLHTSGTTSRPKCVPLSHTNLIASARQIAQTYQLSSEDVSFCVMPLYHVHGLVGSTLAALWAGGTVVIVPRFNALSFWSTVRQYGVTWFSAVPTIHQLLLSRVKPGTRPAGAEQLRFIRSSSAPLPPAMMAQMEESFGVPVVEAYGMTEAAHQMTSNPLPPGRRKPGSVGPGTGVSIAILDDQGHHLPLGTTGAVAVKGPNVFRGYENNPEANAESFTDGWFRTGDEGWLDSDGYLTLVGRTKEMINRGGEKISPREIDEVLLMHPAVAEAVTFAVPDQVYGEEVAAAVVLKASATPAQLLAHCRSVLADFKCPKVIHLVDAIPRTAATGKVQRRVVAAEIARRMQQQGGS
ncbi:MAG: acyl--CoA ligase [Acidobacteriota bacterium]|nr:acyl--CoA ligase [Blastocatellia bacterium]MDW8240562.1 acyl--CoA ligase [Acidobacteriota bacterium]